MLDNRVSLKRGSGACPPCWEGDLGGEVVPLQEGGSPSPTDYELFPLILPRPKPPLSHRSPSLWGLGKEKTMRSYCNEILFLLPLALHTVVNDGYDGWLERFLLPFVSLFIGRTGTLTCAVLNLWGWSGLQTHPGNFFTSGQIAIACPIWLRMISLSEKLACYLTITADTS